MGDKLLDLRHHLLEEATRNPDFWLYIVENVGQGDPDAFTVEELEGERLQKILARAKEQHYYTVPWPVGDHNTLS